MFKNGKHGWTKINNIFLKPFSANISAAPDLTFHGSVARGRDFWTDFSFISDALEEKS